MNHTTSSNIVTEWLRSLHLGQYADSFIDNGYDDLEICKQVGDPDLDAIGVFNPTHRNTLLQSVRSLREEGAASVYFTLEEATAIHDECVCESAKQWGAETSGFLNAPTSSYSNREQEVGFYYDDYEEGKTELVKIPKMQLKMLLREKLDEDGIRLSCQPYSNKLTEHQRVVACVKVQSYIELISPVQQPTLHQILKRVPNASKPKSSCKIKATKASYKYKPKSFRIEDFYRIRGFCCRLLS